MKKPKFIAEFDDIPTSRAKMPELPLNERKLNFTEVELGLVQNIALAEAARCLSCRRCIGCGLCLAECDSDAIVYDMEDTSSKASFDAVVAAPGAEPYNPASKPELGYAESPNIVTTFELERVMNPAGPYGGLPLRPGDGTYPACVAFVQCVGSREEGIGAAYCSSSCCTQALEQAAALARAVPGIAITFFHREMRPLGRHGEALLAGAEEDDSTCFVFCEVVGVSGPDCEGPVTVKYDDGGGEKEAEFDLVVLSVGRRAPRSVRRLARSIGGSQNKFGYIQSTPLAPVATGEGATPVAGTSVRPMDVGGAVAAGVAAASAALDGVDAAAAQTAPGAAESGRVAPAGADGPAVVVLCEYWLATAGLDAARVSDLVGKLDGASAVLACPTACVTPSVRRLGRLADERGASRLLVVGCYPGTHDAFWRERGSSRSEKLATVDVLGAGSGTDAASLARSVGEWVGGGEIETCGTKAVPRELSKRALVVGGGVTGLSAAAELARRGVAVTLVKEAGDPAPRLRGAAMGDGDSVEALASLVERVEADPAIEVVPGSTVASIERTARGFETKIEGRSGTIEHGALVLAGEATDYDAAATKGGPSGRVITQLELAERLAGGASDVGNVVMIQCVGSRTPEHPYCSRNCCAEALTHVHRILAENPDAALTVLHRGIRVWGFDEEMFSDAIDLGVRFVHVKAEPVVSEDGTGVTAVDERSGEELSFEPDLVVLSTGVVAAGENRRIAEALGLEVDGDGFLPPADEAIAPVRGRCDGPEPCERRCEGVFVCGTAAWPASIEESVTQALAAAGKASLYLTKGRR